MTDDVLRLRPGQHDLRMMQTPDLWPLGPVLCLIRPDEAASNSSIPVREGVLVLHPEIPRTEVFLLNVHDDRMRGLLAGSKDGIDSIVYSSWQQLYDAGWRVD